MNKISIIFQCASHKLSIEVKSLFSKAANTPAATPVSEQGQMGRAVHPCLLLHPVPFSEGRLLRVFVLQLCDYGSNCAEP